MRPEDNPYTPNAGARPAVLVGRDDELETFRTLLLRLERGYTEQSMLITGLRGVGKTVLLGAFERLAQERAWAIVRDEISRDDQFPARVVELVRTALFQLAPRERWRDRARRAARALRSFSLTISPDGGVTGSLGVEALEGVADSHNFARDLADLLIALGEAANEQGTGVVFLIDEMQLLATTELEALIAALHQTVQRNLAVTLVGAGLPHLARLSGEAKSYAERLFKFPTIGSLSEADTSRALTEAAAEGGATWTPDALSKAFQFTEGYPFFLQEVGQAAWLEAASSPINVDDVSTALPKVEAKLDAGFFRVRSARTTDDELVYMRAVASLGPQPQLPGHVAQIIGRAIDDVEATRRALIAKGLMYEHDQGRDAFTVPQFDAYLRRTFVPFDSDGPSSEREAT
jgi:hypothetical protein